MIRLWCSSSISFSFESAVMFAFAVLIIVITVISGRRELGMGFVRWRWGATVVSVVEDIVDIEGMREEAEALVLTVTRFIARLFATARAIVCGCSIPSLSPRIIETTYKFRLAQRRRVVGREAWIRVALSTGRISISWRNC